MASKFHVLVDEIRTNSKKIGSLEIDDVKKADSVSSSFNGGLTAGAVEEFIDMIDSDITEKLCDIISATKTMLNDMADHFEKTDSEMKY